MLPLEETSGPYTHPRLDYHATVREMPSHERLGHFGAGALSLAELLAIILRTGSRGDNAVELAKRLLSKYGGLPGLVRTDFRELCGEHGMGETKSAQVKAALEIGRRLASAQVDTRYRISTSAEAAHLVMLEMAYLDSEQMRPESTRGALVHIAAVMRVPVLPSSGPAESAHLVYAAAMQCQAGKAHSGAVTRLMVRRQGGTGPLSLSSRCRSCYPSRASALSLRAPSVRDSEACATC